MAAGVLASSVVLVAKEKESVDFPIENPAATFR